ncbi:lipid A biosynthesis lauroyl acyltransferase [Helicobacter sp. 13S00477-4]|nr:lipid A biosynthesis lauroyl acyltransferase [Helicobacter sp. 13S00477-4]
MRKFDKRRFKDAKANLDFVYGQSLNEIEKENLIHRCYRNFAFILLESIRVVYIPKSKYKSRFQIINKHYLTDSLKGDKSIVLMSGHYGYWEAMATILPQEFQGYDLASLGRLTDYKAINDLIISRREACGVRLIDKKGAFKHLLKMYSNSKAVVGILLDQNISIDEGIWVDFFGKETTHSTIASILSRRFEVDIVPVFIDFNQDYSKFEIRFYPPIRTQITENATNDIYESTQKQAKLTEEIIRQNPSAWFWFHKRWKSKYGEIYQHPPHSLSKP